MKKWTVWGLLTVLTLSPLIPTRALAMGSSQSTEPDLATQITTDLLGAGITVGATLSGNVPLALMAGLLTKYIATYGIAGVRALIQSLKTKEPRDLGEMNIYAIYLIHIKRNLYQGLMDIRKSVTENATLSSLNADIENIEKSLAGTCDPKTGCKISAIDESQLNAQFLNLLIDAKQSYAIEKYLSKNEIKNTYQYLMMLYLDLQVVEQKLLDSQGDILAQRISESEEVIQENKYLSNAEKEYQIQLMMNVAIRWRLMAERRRKTLFESIQQPLAALKKENNDLDQELGRYEKN